MYVIKMKTLIYYFAVFAIVLASIGVIRLYSPQPEATVTTAESSSDNPIADADKDDVLAAAKEQKIDVPILMYHSILRSTNTGGNYIITESAFEKDLKYLKETNYTNITINTLSFSDMPTQNEPFLNTKNGS